MTVTTKKEISDGQHVASNNEILGEENVELYKQQFLQNTALSAEQAGHIWPEYAACEAALESRFGASALAVQANNLFGMKAHANCAFPVLNLPTREFIKGLWQTVEAHWVIYPNLRACFDDRMATLKRLAPEFPHYAAALIATDGSTYVNEVSKTWSTDPFRAQKVIAIYNVWKRNET